MAFFVLIKLDLRSKNIGIDPELQMSWFNLYENHDHEQPCVSEEDITSVFAISDRLVRNGG